MANPDIDYDKLGMAVAKAQAELADAKSKADAAAAAIEAEKHAKAAAVQAEKDRVQAEKDAQAAEKREKAAAEKKAKIAAVLSAVRGDVFVDQDGAEHRVVGVIHNGIDTVSRDRDGGVVGNWRDDRNCDALLAWKRKA